MKSFHSISRKCKHDCHPCRENVCPLMIEYKREESLKRKFIPRPKAFLKLIMNYFLGIAAIIVGVILVARPDLMHPLLIEQPIHIRMIIAAVPVLTGTALMRIANKYNVHSWFDKFDK